MTEHEPLAERVTPLEELLSHQDRRYEQLNQVLVELADDHERLKTVLARRIDRLELRLEDRANPLDPDEKPPHY